MLTDVELTTTGALPRIDEGLRQRAPGPHVAPHQLASVDTILRATRAYEHTITLGACMAPTPGARVRR